MKVALTNMIPPGAQIEKYDLGYIFGRYAGDPDNYYRAFREWANLIEDIFDEDLGVTVKISLTEVTPDGIKEV